MGGLIEFFRTLFGLDYSSRKSAQYFYDCERAFHESQHSQKNKETHSNKHD